MPTKFSEFFQPAPNPEPIQQRIYNAISNTVDIVDCYVKLYQYIVGGLRWAIKEQRHRLMDNTVDISGLNQVPNQEQMADAIDYFAGTELGELENQALFEFFAMVPQSQTDYGPNVFSLMFDSGSTATAKKAYRQVRFYSQKLLYNDEYATHLAYHTDNPSSTKPLPPGPLVINPAQPVNPDDPNQVSELTSASKALETWVTENYPVLALVVNETNLFSLVFDQAVFTYDDKIDAVGMMLDKIRYLGKTNAGTRKAFGLEALTQLHTNSTFWSNKTISGGAWTKITELEPAFKKNATANAKILDSFKTLFTNFLSMKNYPGEPNPDARRASALLYIGTIFKASFGSGRVPKNYSDTMAKALQQIQSEYKTRYTNNLIRARAAVPGDNQINPILPTDLAEEIKEKADECLKTLPLVLADNTRVRIFTIPNYDDLKALNEKSVNVTKNDQHRSSVVVPSDPDEDNTPFPRPIYRSIRFGSSMDEYVAFCNLPNLQNGTFYYRHIDSPAVAKVPAINVFGRILTIDFQNYTIEYPGKKDKEKNDAGEAYRQGGSTVNFYKDLKVSTRWKNIKGVRRYDPYYQTNQINPGSRIPHLTGFVAAGGRGARALALGDDNLCVWWWNCDRPYEKLGAILGLPAARQIPAANGWDLAWLNAEDTGFTRVIDGKQCDFYNYGPVRFQSNKFWFQIIGITPPGEKEQFYVRVNTPFAGVAEELTKYKKTVPRRESRRLEDTPKGILSLFDFCYYRRITSITNDDGDIDFADSSKVIQLFKAGDKRKPSGPATEVLQWTTLGYDAVGVNLPICFNIPENIIEYFLDKQSRGKIINKGDALYREDKPRKDAGTAMKPLFGLLKPPFSKKVSSSKIPATPFANGAMALSLLVREDWGVLKLSSSNYMPVSQEWCHLRGHGDGGNEYPGNFVSGSYHCNTEQLAIETGQRLVTQQEPERSFVLHTTAYLLRDAKDYKSANQADQESQILSDNYLRNETAYQAMLSNNIARRSREQGQDPGKKRKIVMAPPEQGSVAPLAAYFRYKVMRCDTQTSSTGGKIPKSKKRNRDDTDEQRLKSFDFIFEGQSEFIDVHQFTITSQAVRFALAGLDKFNSWYVQEKAELDAKTTT